MQRGAYTRCTVVQAHRYNFGTRPNKHHDVDGLHERVKKKNDGTRGVSIDMLYNVYDVASVIRGLVRHELWIGSCSEQEFVKLEIRHAPVVDKLCAYVQRRVSSDAHALVDICAALMNEECHSLELSRGDGEV